MSKKFSAAALIAITAWPGSATGSGTSARTRSSGWQYCEQRMAFMDSPGVRAIRLGCEGFMPDLIEADNWIRSRFATSGRNQEMFEKNLLEGKRILVTGGGSGLGAAM